jgi:hypothetical protein
MQSEDNTLLVKKTYTDVTLPVKSATSFLRGTKAGTWKCFTELCKGIEISKIKKVRKASMPTEEELLSCIAFRASGATKMPTEIKNIYRSTSKGVVIDAICVSSAWSDIMCRCDKIADAHLKAAGDLDNMMFLAESREQPPGIESEDVEADRYSLGPSIERALFQLHLNKAKMWRRRAEIMEDSFTSVLRVLDKIKEHGGKGLGIDFQSLLEGAPFSLDTA